MKFTISNTYQLANSTDPIKTYEDHSLRDSKWNEELYNNLGSNSKVLKEEMTEDHLHIEILVQPRSEAIPGLLKTVLGANAIDFVETTDYNFQTHQGTMSTKLQSSALSGTSTRGAFSLRSENPGTVTWSTEGEVNSSLWLVGPKVERTVVSAVRDQNPKIRGYIQEHLNKTSEETSSSVHEGDPTNQHPSTASLAQENYVRSASYPKGGDGPNVAAVRSLVKQVITKLAVLDDACMDVSTVTGGITNLLFKVEFTNGAHEPVLVRIFGGEGMIERNLENATYQALARVGVAPRYFGRFENGRIEGFLQGFKDLDLADMAQPEIMKRVAGAMADLHRYEIPLELRPFYQTPGMWNQLWGWFEQAKQALGDGALAKWGSAVAGRYGKIEDELLGKNMRKAQGELQMLTDTLEQGEASPTVFAHNDLLAGNIMLNRETGAIYLIDFEYGGCNYRGFDIANHWNEWAGGTQTEMNARPDYLRFPSDQQQLDFCQAYLDQLCGTSGVQAQSAEALVKEARMFVLVNHWYWGLWALNQAVEEGIADFDYLTYAEMRIGQYYQLAAQYSDQTA